MGLTLFAPVLWLEMALIWFPFGRWGAWAEMGQPVIHNIWVYLVDRRWVRWRSVILLVNASCTRVVVRDSNVSFQSHRLKSSGDGLLFAMEGGSIFCLQILRSVGIEKQPWDSVIYLGVSAGLCSCNRGQNLYKHSIRISNVQVSHLCEAHNRICAPMSASSPWATLLLYWRSWSTCVWFLYRCSPTLYLRR